MPARGTPLFYLAKERELHQGIEAFSGAEHGTSRFQELRAKLDGIPERYQARVLVALTNKIGELPPDDRLPNFRAMAIRATGLHPENRDPMKQAMVVQVGLMPPLESFAAFKIKAMYCADQIPKQADWQEPAFTTHVDELSAEQQMPAVHAALDITSQWQPEHRKVIVGMLAGSVPAMLDNHMEALRTILDSAQTLPQRDYGKVLSSVVNRLDLFPEPVRGEASVELRERVARLRQEQPQ
ncbi:hypothetical protein [Herbaspirillum sp. ST 5-3]|uniref:hypothetical protein n=1 Tax=Oxalobacteraceae TaxID=75682 RepID=UPI0010A2B526|nr:hypothetical protein [Herbaspirillum sp. ST 5-3]